MLVGISTPCMLSGNPVFLLYKESDIIERTGNFFTIFKSVSFDFSIPYRPRVYKTYYVVPRIL